MIAVDKRGRLGNQMFQYAFGVAAAQILGTRFAYDTHELERYFDLLGSRPGRAATRLAAWALDRTVGLERRDVPVEGQDEPADILARLADRTYYGGYFHSERFFSPASVAVRRAFTVRGVHRERFEAKYASLVEGGYICAHVRLTDYFTFRDDVTLPPGYYRRALGVLDGDLPVIVVSDDPDRVRTAFEGDSQVRVETNDEIVDFQLLRRATHVISSNSSFSWWAAWLNDRPSARVIAPRWWLGLHDRVELPANVIPERWETLEPRCPEDGEWPSAGRP
jgi:hypothetical protein